jgi:hypothetical protein
VGNPDGKRPLGIPRRRWVDNIKMNLREIEWDMDWIGLAQDRDQWRALVNTVMNLRVLMTDILLPQGCPTVPGTQQHFTTTEPQQFSDCSC